MRRSRFGAVWLALWLASALWPAAAVAQDDDLARAKQQYQLGYQALQGGRYQVALEHYQRSFELAPRPRTLFNIAVAEEKLGRVDDAIRHYTEFLDVAEERDQEFVGRARRKIEELSRDRARAREDEVGSSSVAGKTTAPPIEVAPPLVGARCPAGASGTLRVRSNLAGAMVSVDGLVVGTTSLAHRDAGSGAAIEHRLAAGEHEVLVERAGSPPWHRRVYAAPGETVGVAVEYSAPRSGRARALGWGLAGLGAVGVVTGGTLGVLALRDVASPDLDRHDRGKTRALATDLLIVGSAAALYGAWRLVRRPKTRATVHRGERAAEVTR